MVLKALSVRWRHRPVSGFQGDISAVTDRWSLQSPGSSRFVGCRHVLRRRGHRRRSRRAFRRCARVASRFRRAASRRAAMWSRQHGGSRRPAAAPTDSSARCHARARFDPLGIVSLRVRKRRRSGDVRSFCSADSRSIATSTGGSARCAARSSVRLVHRRRCPLR